MTAPEEKPVGLPFLLYDYGHTRLAGEVSELIEAGRLPFDTFFRLAAVGQRADHDDGIRPEYLLSYTLMIDMVKHVDTPDLMRPETQQLLWGEPPDAIVDVNSRINYPSYSTLEPMYYRMADLMDVIRRRRLEHGQTLPERDFDRTLHAVQDEAGHCRGIARPIWRLIAQRYHPEWLETPRDYFPSAYIGHLAVVYTFGERRMRRGIVSNAVFSGSLVMSIYNEAVNTGVRGVGPVGKEDLRVLLSDEHPELLEGHELPYVAQESLPA